MKSKLEIEYEMLNINTLSETEKKLFEEAKNSRLKAYAPYSKFLVGCSILLENGEIYKGSNQENAAYPSGLCAERTVLFYAGARYPEAAVREMVLVAFSASGRVPLITPCGACRQVMLEVCSRHRPFPILMVGEEEAVRVSDVRLLLPFSFDGCDLER